MSDVMRGLSLYQAMDGLMPKKPTVRERLSHGYPRTVKAIHQLEETPPNIYGRVWLEQNRDVPIGIVMATDLIQIAAPSEPTLVADSRKVRAFVEPEGIYGYSKNYHPWPDELVFQALDIIRSESLHRAILAVKEQAWTAELG